MVVWDSSWCAHAARNKAAEADRSKDRMVSFFIIDSSCIQVFVTSVTGRRINRYFFPGYSGDRDLSAQLARGINGVDHLHERHRLVRVVYRLGFAADSFYEVLQL